MKIKTEQISLLRALLVTQMNHWVFFPVYATCMVVLRDIVGSGTPYILLWLALGCVPFLLYVGRQRIQKFRSFTLLHFLVIVMMFLLPAAHIAIRVFWIFVGMIYVVYSVYLYFKTKERQDSKLYPLFIILIPFAMLYILHYQGHYNWDKTYVTTLIVTLGLYFIVYYIERYQHFLKVNNSSAGHIPATEMFRSGVGLVLGYTAIGILILVLISNISWLRGVLNFIKDAFLTFIYWLLSLFPHESGSMPEDVAITPQITVMDGAGMLEDGETFWLWNVLEYALEIVLIVGIAIVAIKALFFLFKFIRNRMGSLQHKETNDSEEAVIDVREKCDIVKNRNSSFKLPLFNADPAKRIRQMYKKRILASQNSFKAENTSVLAQYTARECGQILEREQLAVIYEKARYSNAQCNNEDVKRMKNACK